NNACPFGSFVEGRPSLCMMTSNVFGSITAENLGYARVEIQEAVALCHPGCRVVVHLKPTDARDLDGCEEWMKAGQWGEIWRTRCSTRWTSRYSWSMTMEVLHSPIELRKACSAPLVEVEPFWILSSILTKR